MFYNLNHILTYNAYLNFLLGERGVGKTYSAKKFVINKFLKKNEQFIYLRRYSTEIEEIYSTFFEDISIEFPNHDLRATKKKCYCDGKVCGYIIPLSTSNIRKSVVYNKVTTIIFDEFIIDKGCYHYLSNEVETFLEFVETVFRLRDNVRVLFLANSITQSNPYFLYFDIKLPYNSTIRTFNDNLILVEIMKNLEYRKVKKNTRFGKLVKNTNYGSYAIDNQFLRDNNDFIEKKTGNSSYIFGFIYKNNKLGVWIDSNAGKIFISRNFQEDKPTFSCSLEDHRPNTLLLKSIKNYNCWRIVIDNFKMSNIYYENQKIKNLSYELFKKIIY